MTERKVCTVCGARAIAKDFCRSHYDRWRRYGDPRAGADAPAGPRQWSEDDRALALLVRNQQREADSLVTTQTGFLLGANVLCTRKQPAAGTWHRYAGRTGKVVGFTIDRSGDPPYVEVGVSFVGGSYPDAWFLPTELEAA